jgi:hypothetical protein
MLTSGIASSANSHSSSILLNLESADFNDREKLEAARDVINARLEQLAEEENDNDFEDALDGRSGDEDLDAGDNIGDSGSFGRPARTAAEVKRKLKLVQKQLLYQKKQLLKSVNPI